MQEIFGIHLCIRFLGLRKPNTNLVSLLLKMLQAFKLPRSETKCCRCRQKSILNAVVDGRDAKKVANVLADSQVLFFLNISISCVLLYRI